MLLGGKTDANSFETLDPRVIALLRALRSTLKIIFHLHCNYINSLVADITTLIPGLIENGRLKVHKQKVEKRINIQSYTVKISIHTIYKELVEFSTTNDLYSCINVIITFVYFLNVYS